MTVQSTSLERGSYVFSKHFTKTIFSGEKIPSSPIFLICPHPFPLGCVSGPWFTLFMPQYHMNNRPQIAKTEKSRWQAPSAWWQRSGLVYKKADGGTCAVTLYFLPRASVLFCVLLGSTGQLDTVDLNKLNEIEGTLNKAKDEMKVSDLDRKVSDLENEARKQEAALMDYNRDIEGIMKDIRNLEDIKKTLPSGCFNTPSIEKP